MVRQLVSIPALYLSILISGCSTVPTTPLSLDISPNWSGQWQGQDGTASTEFLRSSGARLELHQHSRDRAGEASNSMLRWEHLNHEFSGVHCQGRYSYFSEAEPDLVVFMMTVDDTLWSGVFRGSPEDWKDALALLKTAKRRDSSDF